jgi:hypothetical protein
MVGIIRVNIPFVFFDLDPDPFLPAATDFAALRRVGQPTPPACAETVCGVLRTFRGIQVQILAEALDRFQLAGVCEGHRRFSPAIDLDGVRGTERNVEGAATLPGFLRPAPYTGVFAVLRSHAD